jgi:hypothetical protein
MQELLFSRRTVLLFENTASVECCCTVQHACLPFTEPDSRDIDHRKQLFLRARALQYTPWPDLEEYAHLVCEYNSKQLTYVEDAYRAFLGVMVTLGRTFERGMLYGLPEMFFDVCLLWQPFGVLKRRKTDQSTAYEDSMPSWSWLGWQGELDPRSWACGYEYIHEVDSRFHRKVRWQKTSWKTIPTVKWYCGILGQPQRRRIYCTSQAYKGTRCERVAQDSRWTKLQDSPQAEPYFQHESDMNTKFKYPIPMRNPTKRPEVKLPTPVLFCRTRRTHLHLRKPIYPRDAEAPEPECVTMSLISGKEWNSSWVGILPINYSAWSQRNTFRCELVEISAGSASNTRDEDMYLDEWSYPDRPKEGELCEFYNVLWIEWSGDVAYRKALGRVLKRFWNAKASESIELTLG